MEQTKERANEVIQTVQKTAADTSEYLANTVDSVKSGVEETMSQYGNQGNAQSGFGLSGSSPSYLDSNSMIAKLAFVVLVLIVFVALMRLGIKLISFFYNLSSMNPYMVKGMIPGNQSITISQDPQKNSQTIIQRSNNQSTGIEFTWSVWIMVTDLPTSNNNYMHVFNKGRVPMPSSTNQGIATTGNAPGVYIFTPKLVDKAVNSDANTLTVRVVMDTVDDSNKPASLDIADIPFNKWVNIVVRLENTLLDVYVNGIIGNRMQTTSVPKQNYADVNIGQNGGFPGNLSNLRYYSYALSAFEINGIVMWGPNTNASSIASSITNKDASYLSRQWYYNKL